MLTEETKRLKRNEEKTSLLAGTGCIFLTSDPEVWLRVRNLQPVPTNSEVFSLSPYASGYIHIVLILFEQFFTELFGLEYQYISKQSE